MDKAWFIDANQPGYFYNLNFLIKTMREKIRK